MPTVAQNAFFQDINATNENKMSHIKMSLSSKTTVSCYRDNVCSKVEIISKI